MKIALCVNTRLDESEFQVEYDPPHTIELIRNAIEKNGHEYSFIEADEDFVANLQLAKPDLVFNRSEGLRGDSRESHVPAMLEMLNIPYIGSNVLTTAVCLNKAWTKKILSYHGIPTPHFFTVKTLDDLKNYKMINPVILKPNEEGSSVGINEDNVVHNNQQLTTKLNEMFATYRQPILVEEFIQGREFSVGVIGGINEEFEVLSILEIDFSQLPSEVGGVFGQRAKTTYDDLDHYICPANITDKLSMQLVDTSLNICKVLDIKDFARIDFRMDKNNQIYTLEINPLPGMDFDLENKDFSFYPYMAIKSGYPYNDLILRLIKSACKRYKLEI
ncbi:MAG: ATP-grasp domain-containing protein [Candidatus Heimdallarchaeota archaeon]|nr:ATP-grasp domain-containing protein [Candidatus Heimdallarchaeota archaeon]